MHRVARWNRNPRNQRNANPANIKETDTGYLIDLVVPGYDKADINIRVEDKVLIVEADAPEQSTTYNYREWSRAGFNRKWTLGKHIDPDHINASLQAGILRIELAKVPEASPRLIEIQ